MPGVRGPSDYSQEPPRHPSLQINAKEPFNAEPHRLSLITSYVTPVDLFYKRNHGPIPIVDDIERYRVSIRGLVENSKELSMTDIRKLPKYEITATLQCAGNRRTAMSKTKTVKGVGWDVSAIGNATWGGAKLSDVLELVGIPKLTGATPSGGKHVEFVSVDMCKEEKGGPYKASIPLNQATNPEADVLLAYEMNGEVLAKVCVNRMMPVLQKLISPSQCAFVPGSHIQDHIFLYHEVIYSFKKKKGKEGWAILNIDYSKAYDRMSWKFIQKALRRLGFSPKWTPVLMYCVTTTSLQMLNNEPPPEVFYPHSGLRQGDA